MQTKAISDALKRCRLPTDDPAIYEALERLAEHTRASVTRAIEAGQPGGRLWKDQRGRWIGSPRDLFTIGMLMIAEGFSRPFDAAGKGKRPSHGSKTFKRLLSEVYLAAGIENEPPMPERWASHVRKARLSPIQRSIADEANPSTLPTVVLMARLEVQDALGNLLPPAMAAGELGNS